LIPKEIASIIENLLLLTVLNDGLFLIVTNILFQIYFWEHSTINNVTK